jgi:hypothetical protein
LGQNLTSEVRTDRASKPARSHNYDVVTERHRRRNTLNLTIEGDKLVENLADLESFQRKPTALDTHFSNRPRASTEVDERVRERSRTPRLHKAPIDSITHDGTATSNVGCHEGTSRGGSLEKRLWKALVIGGQDDNIRVTHQIRHVSPISEPLDV